MFFSLSWNVIVKKINIEKNVLTWKLKHFHLVKFFRTIYFQKLIIFNQYYYLENHEKWFFRISSKKKIFTVKDDISPYCILYSNNNNPNVNTWFV